MENKKLLIDRETFRSVMFLKPEVSAIVGMRASVRALSLLSIYSEGTNKANFYVPPFGFWPLDERAKNIEYLFASHQAFVNLSRNNFCDVITSVEAEDNVRSLVLSAYDSYKKQQRDGISFSSLARKNAFETVHQLICHVLEFFLIPFKTYNHKRLASIQSVNELQIQLDTETPVLCKVMADLTHSLKKIDSLKVVNGYREHLLNELAVKAKNTNNRLSFFSSLVAEYAKDKDVIQLTTFSQQALTASELYAALFNACVTSNSQEIKYIAEKISAVMEAYEIARVDMLPYDSELNMDFYVDNLCDVLDTVICSFDSDFCANIQCNVDELRRCSEDLLVRLSRGDSYELLSSDIKALLELTGNFKSKYRGVDLDIDFPLGFISSLDTVFDKLLLQRENLTEKETSALTMGVNVWISDWLEELFEFMEVDVESYTSHSLCSYAEILYSQLLIDLHFCRNESQDDIWIAPLWSKSALLQVKNWEILWGIFWKDVEATGLSFEHYKRQYREWYGY